MAETTDTSAQYEEIPVGYLPFDHYLAEQWNPEAPESRDEQLKTLVARYIDLGPLARRPYHEKVLDGLGEDAIPPGVPRNLHTPAEREAIGLMSRTWWIRTWYGADGADRQAEEQYLRLRRKAWYGSTLSIPPIFVFEDRVAFAAADTSTIPAFTSPPPPFLLNALVRFPDALQDLPSEDRMAALDEEGFWDSSSDREQSILIMVADKSACDTGKLLLLGLNYRGQVLPWRIRCPASTASVAEGNWADGQPLVENFDEDASEVEELDYYNYMDGWDGPE